MINKSYLLALSFFALFILGGCITISYDAEQEFNEDGTSVLTIDEYIGVNKELLSSSESLSSLSSKSTSTILLEAMVDYYGSSSYSSLLCNLVDQDDVKECNPQNDGNVNAIINLEPGDFYSYESTTDWINLKEIKTYTIDEVPMFNYYASKDGDYQDQVTDSLKTYLSDNINKYLDEDIYCMDYYPLSCNISSYSKNKLNIEISTSSYNEKMHILWVACSNEDSSEFLFMNEVEAKELLGTVVELDEVLSSSNPLTLSSLSCLSNPKSIVVAYETESYSGTITNNVDALDIKTKEDMKDDLIKSLDSGSGSGIMGGSASMTKNLTNYEDYVLNFRTGKIMASDYEQWDQMTGASAQMMKLDISIDYAATFPGKVVSAMVDETEVEFSGNRLELSLNDIKDLPSNSLVVVTEKELSPFGIFTWVIVVGVFLVIVVLAFFALRKK